MDAVTAHNKGQFSHLSKLTGPERVEHDGWFRVNLFDTHKKKKKKKKRCQVPHLEPSNLFPVTSTLSCFKVHVKKLSDKEMIKKTERRPGPLALTA